MSGSYSNSCCYGHGYDQKNKITDTSLRCELFGSFTVKTCCFSRRKESVEVVWVSEYNAYIRNSMMSHHRNMWWWMGRLRLGHLFLDCGLDPDKQRKWVDGLLIYRI